MKGPLIKIKFCRPMATVRSLVCEPESGGPGLAGPGPPTAAARGVRVRWLGQWPTQAVTRQARRRGLGLPRLAWTAWPAGHVVSFIYIPLSVSGRQAASRLTSFVISSLSVRQWCRLWLCRHN